jgi:hypothetical protein
MHAHVLYTYEGVMKLSTNNCNGGSALKGFTEAGFKAGCLLGSSSYGSSMFERISEDSSSFKLPKTNCILMK